MIKLLHKKKSELEILLSNPRQLHYYNKLREYGPSDYYDCINRQYEKIHKKGEYNLATNMIEKIYNLQSKEYDELLKRTHLKYDNCSLYDLRETNREKYLKILNKEYYKYVKDKFDNLAKISDKHELRLL